MNLFSLNDRGSKLYPISSTDVKSLRILSKEKVEMRALFSISWGIRAQVNKDAIETLAFMNKGVMTSRPFSKWDRLFCRYTFYKKLIIFK